MEVSVHEIVALFEGLLNAEERRLRSKYPRNCRFKWEIEEDSLHVQISVRKRKFELYVGDQIDMVAWYNSRSCGVDDYISDFTNLGCTDGNVLQLVRLMQARYFPILENPDTPSEELFPEMWE